VMANQVPIRTLNRVFEAGKLHEPKLALSKATQHRPKTVFLP